jgi:hypothetical protein
MPSQHTRPTLPTPLLPLPNASIHTSCVCCSHTVNMHANEPYHGGKVPTYSAQLLLLLGA